LQLLLKALVLASLPQHQTWIAGSIVLDEVCTENQVANNRTSTSFCKYYSAIGGQITENNPYTSTDVDVAAHIVLHYQPKQRMPATITGVGELHPLNTESNRSSKGLTKLTLEVSV